MSGSVSDELAFGIVPEDDASVLVVEHPAQGGGDLRYVHQAALAPVTAFTSANRSPNLP